MTCKTLKAFCSLDPANAFLRSRETWGWATRLLKHASDMQDHASTQAKGPG
jgi:hypothetical protein